MRKDWSCGEAGDKERAVAGGVMRLELAEESPLDRGETSSISSSRSEEQKIDIGIAELMAKNEYCTNLRRITSPIETCFGHCKWRYRESDDRSKSGICLSFNSIHAFAFGRVQLTVYMKETRQTACNEYTGR